MDDDRGIERGVSVRARHQPHAHDGTRALDRRVHAGRPVDRSAVSPRLDPVGRQATPAEVVVLEVSVGFPEAEQIEVVAEEVADVEEVEDVLLVALGIGRVERELAVAVSSKAGPLVSRWAMTELFAVLSLSTQSCGEPRGKRL